MTLATFGVLTASGLGAVGALVAAAAFAVGNWVAVATKRKTLEYVCKPAVMLALVGLALAVETDDPAGRRGWIVVALVCSLAGDVFLMLPSDRFVEGLASFLLAHVAYIVAFARGDGNGDLPVVVLAAAAIFFTVVVWVLKRVANAAWADDRLLGGAVTVYGLTILAMGVTVLGSGEPVATVGAALFMTSDALIGWSRFVNQDLQWAPLAIIVTYHVAQVALVLSLVV